MFDPEKRCWQTPLWRKAERWRKAKLASGFCMLSIGVGAAVALWGWGALLFAGLPAAIIIVYVACRSRRHRANRMAKLLKENVLSDVVSAGMPAVLVKCDEVDSSTFRDQKGDTVVANGGRPQHTYLGILPSTKVALETQQGDVVEVSMLEYLEGWHNESLVERRRGVLPAMVEAQLLNRDHARMRAEERSKLSLSGDREVDAALPPPKVGKTSARQILEGGVALIGGWSIRVLLVSLPPFMVSGQLAKSLACSAGVVTISLVSVGILVYSGEVAFSPMVTWPLPSLFGIAESRRNRGKSLEDRAPRLPYAQPGDALTLPNQKDRTFFFVGLADKETFVVQTKNGKHETYPAAHYADCFNLSLRERGKRGRKIQADLAIKDEPRNWPSTNGQGKESLIRTKEA